MQCIHINTAQPYDVLVGRGTLSQVGQLAAPLLSGRQAVIVSDSNVWPLYGDAVRLSLEKEGFSVENFVFPAGEESKNTEILLKLIHFLAAKGLTRSDAVFALGGGVTGDMAGLAAALYLRGIQCVQIPTSLLAMVDSSVGGKTAVDLPEGKNLLGCFSQPRLVVCDPDALKTLRPAVYAEGWAEIIKYGMILDADLLEKLGSPAAEANIEDVIARCVELKRQVVAQDEQDNALRQILNFGHTIGHAVERCAEFGCYHGEGVAIGMAIMTRATVRQGACPKECADTLEKLLVRYHLPNQTHFSQEKLLEAARADKKRRGESITLIRPAALGKCVMDKTDFKALAEVLKLGMPVA